MDLTQLANLGEFIGGFAMLVTLVLPEHADQAVESPHPSAGASRIGAHLDRGGRRL